MKNLKQMEKMNCFSKTYGFKLDLEIPRIEPNQNTLNSNSEFIGSCDTIEFRGGFVSGELYNQVVLHAAPLTFTSSDVLSFGAIEVLKTVTRKTKHPQDAHTCHEYRGYLPNGLYKKLILLQSHIRYTNSEIIAACLQAFISDEYISGCYRQFVAEKCKILRCGESDLEKLIFDHELHKARLRGQALRSTKALTS